jgi:predicted GNAT family N-acyltransferase
MRAEPHTRNSNSFGRLRFSEKVERVLARSTTPPVSRRATEAEIEAVLAAAGRMFPVAPIEAVRRMRARNPSILRIIEGLGGSDDLSMIAYLPLSAEGAERLLAGTLNGRDPQPEWIVGEHEIPTAVYIWMTWTPGRLARALPGMAQIFSELVPEGCPLFSRAVTDHAARLNAAMGFLPANQIYPGAPDWLLVVLPGREMAPVLEALPTSAPAAPEIAVRPVRSFEDMAMIYAVRSATYISEQFCLYSEEFDGNDFCATHLIGFIDGDPAGCIRLRYFGDFVKVERLAVRREYRRSRLAFRLVREALALARLKGFRRFYGHSRIDLVPFWRMFGFHAMNRPAFRFADVEYREIELDGEAHERPIGMDDDPMVTIRPEGAWNEPGPLELSNLRPSRAAFFNDMKTVSRVAH